MIKTTFQTITGTNLDVREIDTLGVAEFKTKAIIITSNLVAKQNFKQGMYELEELVSYLTEKAIEFAEKFKPEAARDGWKNLGQYLYYTLTSRAKNFNEIQFNYLKRIAPLEGENKDNGEENHVVSTLLSKEDSAFEDAEFFSDTRFQELLSLLSTRQKLILKGRLEGLNGQPLADYVGAGKATVHRDMKKIQNVAISVGISL